MEVEDVSMFHGQLSYSAQGPTCVFECGMERQIDGFYEKCKQIVIVSQ